MAITLTEKAAAEVRRHMEQQEEGTMLRIGIAGGGCSGFAYSLGFDKNCDDEADACFEQHGVKVVVNKKRALYLDGSTIDFYNEDGRQGFVFDNPNVVRSCSCGGH